MSEQLLFVYKNDVCSSHIRRFYVETLEDITIIKSSKRDGISMGLLSIWRSISISEAKNNFENNTFSVLKPPDWCSSFAFKTFSSRIENLMPALSCHK